MPFAGPPGQVQTIDNDPVMVKFRADRAAQVDPRPFASRLLTEKTYRTSNSDFGAYTVNFEEELARVREIKERLLRKLARSKKPTDKPSTTRRVGDIFPDPSNLAQAKMTMNAITERKTPEQIFYAISAAAGFIKHEKSVTSKKDIFKLFDEDDNGSITLGEFRRGLSEFR